MKVAALVLAAGRGERLGHAVPKAFVPIRGVALVLRSLEALSAVPGIERVVPVVAAEDLDLFAALKTDHLPRLAAAVPGGAERQDSVAAGLASLPSEFGIVAVHDAARCLVSPADVSRVVDAAQLHGAAILATPALDTIKRVRDGKVIETPERSECWAAQTPQVFRASLLREALAKARSDGVLGTDDAQLVERLGVAVHVVPGDPGNIKITRPADLGLAEARLAGDPGA